MTDQNKFKCPTPLFIICVFCILSCSQTQKKTAPPEKTKDTVQQNKTQIAHDIPVYGIDVSHFQGTINWNKINNIAFAICKATEGITYTDPGFLSNWSELKTQGMIRGAYHFYVSTDDPVAQSQNFLRAVKDYTKGDLPLIIDIERASIRNHSGSAIQLVDNLLQMLQIIEKKTQIRPILYTNTSFAQSYLSDDRLAAYPLWIADYTKNKTPVIPMPWSPNDWLFWQKTDTYDLDPENKHIDKDLFHGSLEKLHTITKQ